MTLQDETELQTRNDFSQKLKENKKMLVLKFGAEWCGPCKQIDPIVCAFMESSPENMDCYMFDVDDCFDLYAYMKSKKITQAIPTLLAYKSGNTTIAPDFIVVGSDTTKVQSFFRDVQECYKSLM